MSKAFQIYLSFSLHSKSLCCIGITLDSAINTNPKDLASRDAIDRNAPNPKLCAAYGSSAIVLDQRIFLTFNPFNVFVTQGIRWMKMN